jgi:hypothetical protein
MKKTKRKVTSDKKNVKKYLKKASSVRLADWISNSLAKPELAFDATRDKVFALHKFVEIVREAVNKVGCIGVSVLYDCSKISDLLYEEEVEELQEVLKVPVKYDDLVLDVAQRLKDKKG